MLYPITGATSNGVFIGSVILQVKQITADITPILNTFSQGILQNPTAASVLNGLTSGPEVSAFVNQVQSLAAMLSPNIQGLLVKQLRSHQLTFCHDGTKYPAPAPTMELHT